MEQIKGFVDHIIYQKEENGYTVLILNVDGEELTCVGNMRNVGPGETLELQGEYI